jgi:RNA polymerase sigma-70 factor (sigma-E family)
VHANDERAYTEYVTARFDQLRRTAFLLCQQWHRADDITQTTLTNLYLNWRRACAAENREAYVQTMLVRAFLADQRRGWMRRVVLAGDVPDSAIEPDHDDRITVQRALLRVPPRQRATLVLRFFCDFTVEQTAEVLDCTPGTIKSQTARGLEALRRFLASTQPTRA